jgi:hypothetical protein
MPTVDQPRLAEDWVPRLLHKDGKRKRRIEEMPYRQPMSPKDSATVADNGLV